MYFCIQINHNLAKLIEGRSPDMLARLFFLPTTKPNMLKINQLKNI